jgi:germination protein M
MAARKRNDRGSGASASTAFWLAAIVIVLFIFALNWGKIQETLARTNFHEIVKTQGGADKAPKAPAAPEADGKALPKAQPQAEPKAAGPEPLAPKAGPEASVPAPAAPKLDPKAEPKPDAQPRGDSGDQRDARSRSKDPAAPKPLPSAIARSRSAALYFVRIDEDGVIVRQEVKRQVPASDSPLLDALGALLKGPSEEELRKKLVSLVPEGTRLLSVQLRGSTAVLDFNEAFMYNHYGIEGYAGQLKQVVYTATAFPTVQDVQILIDGEKHEYLGGEGVFIGRPLSRNSF